MVVGVAGVAGGIPSLPVMAFQFLYEPELSRSSANGVFPFLHTTFSLSLSPTLFVSDNEQLTFPPLPALCTYLVKESL